MAWLSRKKSVQVIEPEVTEVAGAGVIPMPLGVLVPDSGGISSFLLTMHPDTASAEQQIGELRADVRRGTHAFWAMHDRPAPDENLHVEAIVLIRAKPDSNVVYVVSFLDLESALSFTRFELRRGLHIRNVMIYWAAFTQVREELEGVSIVTTTPPPTVAEAPPDPRPAATTVVAEPEAPRQAAPRAQPAAADGAERHPRQAPQPAPKPEPVTIENTAGVTEPPAIAKPPARQEPQEDEEWPPAKVVRPRRIVQEPAAVEKAAIEEALVLQHPPLAEAAAPPVTDPEAAQRKPAEWTPKRRWALRDDRTPAQQSAAEAPEAAEVVTPEAAAEPIPLPEGPIVTERGDEEAEWDEAVAAGAVVDPADGFPPNSKYDDFDIALEVEQLLKNRKFEPRTGPFSGFKSPPGRF